MARKIIIFITVFCVFLSCFTLVSFADNDSSVRAFDHPYRPVLIKSDLDATFQSTEPYYLFPKVDGQLFFCAEAIRYNYGGTRKLEYKFSLGSSDSYWREFDSSLHVLVGPSNSFPQYFDEDSAGKSFLIANYPLSIDSSKMYSLRPPFDGRSHTVTIDGDAWTRDFLSSNEVWNKMSTFVSITASYSSAILSVPNTTNSINLDSNTLQFTRFTFSKLFSFTKNYCEFYYLFSDVTNQPLPPPVIPDSPDPDAPDLSDFIYVVDFIVNIFNALDGLVILPGLSILDLVYAYFTIFVVRFFLKLVAGG